MPNHDTNHVVVAGTEDDICKFITDACTVDLSTGTLLPDFNKIIPQPPDVLTSLDTPGPRPAWYNWRIKHWGTKWDAYNATRFDVFHIGTVNFPNNFKDVDRKLWAIEMVFDTAWEQPTPILEHIRDDWGLDVWAETIDEGGFEKDGFGINPDGFNPVYKTQTAEFDRESLAWNYRTKDDAE